MDFFQFTVFFIVFLFRILKLPSFWINGDSWYYAWLAKNGKNVSISIFGLKFGFFQAPFFAGLLAVFIYHTLKSKKNDLNAAFSAIISNFLFMFFYRTYSGIFDTDAIIVFLVTIGLYYFNKNNYITILCTILLRFFYNGWYIIFNFIFIKSLIQQNKAQLFIFWVFILFSGFLDTNIGFVKWSENNVMSTISEMKPLKFLDFITQVYFSPLLLMFIYFTIFETEYKNNTSQTALTFLISSLILSFFMSRFLIFLVYSSAFYMYIFNKNTKLPIFITIFAYSTIFIPIFNFTPYAPNSDYIDCITTIPKGAVSVWWDKGGIWRYYDHDVYSTPDHQNNNFTVELSKKFCSHNVSDFCSLNTDYFVLEDFYQNIIPSIKKISGINETYSLNQLFNGIYPNCFKLICNGTDFKVFSIKN